MKYAGTLLIVAVTATADGVTACPVYPDVPGMEVNECLPGIQVSMSNWDNDVKLVFTVSIPAGAQCCPRTAGL